MSPATILDRLPGAPWRPLEVLVVLLGLTTVPLPAAAYVGWKLWRASRRKTSERPAAAGSSPFEAYRRATPDRLAPEEQEFAEVLRELRRPHDPAEFEQFAGRQRAPA